MTDIRDHIIVIILVALLTISQVVPILKARTSHFGDHALSTRLLNRCELWQIFPPDQPVKTIVLACPRMDLTRLWPLPITSPWYE